MYFCQNIAHVRWRRFSLQDHGSVPHFMGQTEAALITEDYFWCGFHAFQTGRCSACSLPWLLLLLIFPDVESTSVEREFRNQTGKHLRQMEASVGKLSAADSNPCVKASRGFPRYPTQTSPLLCRKLSTPHQGRAHPVPVHSRWHIPPESFPLLSSCYLLLCSTRGGRDGFTQHLQFSKPNKLL